MLLSQSAIWQQRDIAKSTRCAMIWSDGMVWCGYHILRHSMIFYACIYCCIIICCDLWIYVYNAYIQTHIQIHTGTDTQRYRDTEIQRYIHTYMHAYIHTYIHAYMHTCIHAYMHAYFLFAPIYWNPPYTHQSKAYSANFQDVLVFKLLVAVDCWWVGQKTQPI